MRKPKVGDELFYATTGNLARNGVKIGTCRVEKVGRKYFYTDLWRSEAKFDINTWQQVTDYCTDYHLYESEKAYNEGLRRSLLLGELGECFSYRRSQKGFTLGMLEEVVKILELEV